MKARDSLGRAASMALGVSTAAIIGTFYPVDAQQSPRPSAVGGCRITGRVTSGDQPLPGVSILIRTDDGVKAATSTDLDGRYTIAFAPSGTYRLTAELATFQPLERPVSASAPPCDSTVDLQLTLQPRSPQGAQGLPAGAPGLANGGAQAGARGAQGAQVTGGRGRGGFQTLNVEPDANGVGADTVAATAATTNADADLQNFLPAGFSLDSAQADAVAINGSSDATSFDRGLMNDRQGAIARGDFAPGAFDGGFPGGDFGGRGFPGGPLGAFADAGGAGGGQNGGPGGRGGPGGPGGPGGRGGPGGPGGPGGRGGPGGPGGRGAQNFVLGGRGAQPPRPYQGSVNYTFGGSILDTPPYQLRPDAPLNDPNYARNNFGVTVGGPIRIPGLYKDTNRRSNFQFNYAGNRSNNIFNQYATVPTAAMRTGDFSATPFALRNPVTGQPFENNQIPQAMIDSGSALMAQYLPLPNLPGTAQNYHVSKVTQTISDSFNLRVTQNLSRNAARGGGPGGRGGGGGRGGPGPGGRGGRGGARGTTIMLNAQVQYRNGQNDVPNVYDGLGGLSNTGTLTMPISLNIIRGRTAHNVNVNFTHATSEATNAFTNTQNVAGAAGIQYPDQASLDPLNWGLPTLNITGYTGLRTPAASSRIENRFTTSYSWSRPVRRHQVRIGAEYRHDGTSSETNSNARGTFQFSGLYTADGAQVVGGTGFGFADFLLGLPAQASVQVAGITKLRDRSFSTFIEDNWQKNSRLTFNLGLRYELIRPFTEIDGRMANLDTLPDFSAATTVVAGGVGPYTGAFPAGLVRTDGNNVGPRVGLAYRLAPGTILRGGYGVSFNNQTYSSIARQLVAQPPFSSTQTVIGSTEDPLDLQTALLSSTSTTTNNWGVDKNYTLGTIQTWNATLQRDLNRTWSFTGGYTGTKGTSLDILRAPNRGPNGLLNPDVQAYTWESSGGHSILYSGTFAIRRRPVRGLSGGVSYTLAKSHDNASSLGAGGTVVAQNDKDLDAEWALSSFDRRHAMTADVSWELPFGPNRRWLAKGGFFAGLVGEWQVTANGTFQSGTPFTARVVGAAQDILQGTNNSLRANYTGADIGLSDPSIDQFFNTSAFRVPPFGTFGNSDRNTIIGPGGHQVNASISRNIRMGRQETMTLSVNANNLFNTVQWANIDTNLNSPTYGQVTSVRAMRAITVNVRMRY